MSAIAIDKANGWQAWSTHQRAHGGPGDMVALTNYYIGKLNTNAPGHGLKNAADAETAAWKGGWQ